MTNAIWYSAAATDSWGSAGSSFEIRAVLDLPKPLNLYCVVEIAPAELTQDKMLFACEVLKAKLRLALTEKSGNYKKAEELLGVE